MTFAMPTEEVTPRQHQTALAKTAADDVRAVRDTLVEVTGGIRALRDKLGVTHPLHDEALRLQHIFVEALSLAHRAASTVAAVEVIGDIHTLVPLDVTDLELHPQHPRHCREEQPPTYRDWRSAAANDLTTTANGEER